MIEIRKAGFPVFLGVLLASLVGSQALSATQPQPTGEPAAAHQRLDSGDVKAYRDVVELIESGAGAYAPELTEELLSLGLALQLEGRHNEAIDVFKRGTHLARINNGLYSATQIPMVQGEISSYLALGKLVEADERQFYVYKVQQRSLSNPDSRVQALMQQAHWQFNAYQLGIGEQRYDRLLNMWDLYRGALTEIATREGDTSGKLLSPLHGLLQTQYLISDYRDESSGMSGEAGFGARQQQNRFNAYRSKSYSQGTAVIKTIYDVEKAQSEDQFTTTAEALVMLGDWMLWHGERDAAEQTYREALGELAELDDAELQTARYFGAPVPLPAIDGVRPLPPVVAAENGDILVEFGVTERGRVTNLTRLDDNEAVTGQANRLLRKLRATVFRPRFEGADPVSTENIINAYKIAQ